MLPPIYPTLFAWPAVSAIVGTRIYPLADHQNSEAYNGFHRAFIPDIFKKEE